MREKETITIDATRTITIYDNEKLNYHKKIDLEQANYLFEYAIRPNIKVLSTPDAQYVKYDGKVFKTLTKQEKLTQTICIGDTFYLNDEYEKTDVDEL